MHVRLIDSLRGLAALAVVIYHADQVVSRWRPPAESRNWSVLAHLGAFGVEVFFVLSGFCIAASLNGAFARGLNPVGFAKARLRRIFPAYWAAFLITLVGVGVAALGVQSGVIGQSSLAGQTDRLEPKIVLLNALLAHVGFGAPGLMPVAWTLCYELVFYAILGLLGFVVFRLHTTQTPLTGAHLVTLAVCGTMWIPGAHVGFPLDMWPAFGLGVAVYERLARQGNAAIQVCVALAFLTVALARTEIGFLPRPAIAFVCVSVGTALTLLVSYRLDGVLWRFRLLRGLARLGEFSYSLYLIHFPVLGVASQILRKVPFNVPYEFCVVLSVLLSLILGKLFWLGVERHFVGKPKIRVVSPRDGGGGSL